MHRLLSLCLACVVLGVPVEGDDEGGLFYNPILHRGAADPWVIELDNAYYLTFTTGNNVVVYKTQYFDHFDDATHSVVWTPPASGPYSGSVWAPELHRIGGQLYIYFAAADGGDNGSHRMYVLKGTNPADPLQPFDFVGQLSTPDNNWAIDGTVLRYLGDDTQLYFIWSGWEDSTKVQTQNLYIAKMDGPTRLTGNRVLLHQPLSSWMQYGSFAINEGPEILVNQGRTFLIYSASASWTQEYCLGMMGIDGGKDPLVPSNWWRLDSRPVFWKSSDVFGPGHASFPHDRSGQSYIVYHAMQDPNGGWANRTLRTQPFGYNPDNSPAFPTPAGFQVPIPEPN